MELYYFAYGSNLHPARLQVRVPSAEFVEVAVLPDRALRFCKRSVDGSAKCTLAPALGSRTLGAVYRLAAQEKELLDRVEGLDQGYDEGWQGLPLNDGVVRAFFYVAAPDYLDATLQPYHWYKHLVLAGARYHGFPDAYIAAIDAVASIEDPDAGRRSRNERIVHACESGGFITDGEIRP